MKIIKTRKSSCVNARGIPTAAYQVLLGGVPSLFQGTPLPGLTGGVPGVPPIGVPPTRSDRGYPEYPCQVPLPWPGLMGVLGVPPHLDLAGVPPPRCGQTDGWTDTFQNITFPRTTYVGGNYAVFVTVNCKSRITYCIHRFKCFGNMQKYES